MSQVVQSNISVYSFPAFITVTSLPAAGYGGGDNGCLPAALAFPVLFTYCLTLDSLIMTGFIMVEGAMMLASASILLQGI